MTDSYRDNPELRHLFVRKCRSCNQEIDVLDYGPEKICPHCGKISAPENITQAHIAFRHMEYGEIGHYINGETGNLTLNVDYKKFWLSYILDIGNISNPPTSNAYLYSHLLGNVKGCSERAQREVDNLALLDKNVEVYLWLPHNDANSYLNMFWFSHLFLRFEKVYLVDVYTGEDMENDNYFPGDSLQHKRLLTKDELQAMPAKFWHSSRNEYRMICNGEFRYFDVEDFDELVLSCMDEEFLFYNAIYSRVCDKFKEKEKMHFPWKTFEIVMWELLKRGKIESSGPCDLWGKGGMMLIERNFRPVIACEHHYSKKDLLRILRDALAYGNTYDLYRVLAEDAYLSWDFFEDGFENEGVVQAIEIAGAYLINYCKESVECVLCTDGKENFDPEHLCLLWSREGEEGKQFYVVHVDIEDDKIARILFSPPTPGTDLYAIYDDEN